MKKFWRTVRVIVIAIVSINFIKAYDLEDEVIEYSSVIVEIVKVCGETIIEYCNYN